MVTTSDSGKVPMGPDVEPYLEAIAAYERAGYDHVTLHQVGGIKRTSSRSWFGRWFRELRAA